MKGENSPFRKRVSILKLHVLRNIFWYGYRNKTEEAKIFGNLKFGMFQCILWHERGHIVTAGEK